MEGDNLIFSVVDLHSLTSRSQPAHERYLAKKQTLAILLAAGLRSDRCTLFYQSDVPQHAQLHWILSCDAGMGSLSRMPAWRDKLLLESARVDSKHAVDVASLLQSSPNPKSQERLKLGLFSYPVLQAADILLYGATHVPVGEDQLVHIEFARDVATTFNANYGGGGRIDPQTSRKQKGRQILVPPQPMVSTAKRLMSLTDPTKKMSKSDPREGSRILLTDDEIAIRKKLQHAVTDSFDGITYEPARRPGVSNLIDIITHIEIAEGQACDPHVVAKDFDDLQAQGSPLHHLKQRAADTVIKHLKPIRERYEELIHESDIQHLSMVAEQGRVEAGRKAESRLASVHEAIGISEPAG